MRKFGSILKRYYQRFMSIINKLPQETPKTVDFTKEELEFIIVKLQSTDYKGYEFEQYFKVYKKLVDKLKTKA